MTLGPPAAWEEAMTKVSPSIPKTRLHTCCFGFCALLAITTSPTWILWSLTDMRSVTATSPLMLKVGSMLGPMHWCREKGG